MIRNIRHALQAGTSFEIRLAGTLYRPTLCERSEIMALPTRVQRSIDFPFENLRDLDNLMRGMFNFNREGGQSGVLYTPYGVDIREDPDHIYVEAELPGFKKDEVDVTLENQTLTISAERKQETGDQQRGEWLLNERRYTRFLRSFTLPPTVDESSVQAKLNDGILTITINKREESKPRKVKVG
jgi:HSP20 family protein